MTDHRDPDLGLLGAIPFSGLAQWCEMDSFVSMIPVQHLFSSADLMQYPQLHGKTILCRVVNDM